HVLLDEGEAWIADVLDVVRLAGRQIVDGDDLVALGKEGIAEVTSQKSGTAGDKSTRHGAWSVGILVVLVWLLSPRMGGVAGGGGSRGKARQGECRKAPARNKGCQRGRAVWQETCLTMRGCRICLRGRKPVPDTPTTEKAGDSDSNDCCHTESRR